MNEYDTTKMFDVLAARYGAEPTDDPLEADVILFNTCSVREKAQEHYHIWRKRLREDDAGSRP